MRRGTASTRLRWIAFSVPIVFLAAFHGALLLGRFADASITRPMVLGRWAFAITLVAAAFIARRFFRGRRAVIIFWLLVAILHLTIPAGGGSNNAALLAATLPALIVAGAAAGTSSTAPWPASTLLLDVFIAFLPLRLDPIRTGRAPPSI